MSFTYRESTLSDAPRSPVALLRITMQIPRRPELHSIRSHCITPENLIEYYMEEYPSLGLHGCMQVLRLRDVTAPKMSAYSSPENVMHRILKNEC